MVTFVRYPRMGLVASGANDVIRGLELSVPPQTSGEGRGPEG